MPSDPNPTRSDALARASALARRARQLRRAQVEVQELTAREVQVLAQTAARFFDAIPLVEFTPALLPQSARGLRRIRHRVLHRTVHSTVGGTLIRAMLLGRDGALRLFSARSSESRDLLLILETGRTLPGSVMRDVVDWTPTLRVPGFRPFEILEKLSHSLDSVEAQLTDAEQRVVVQKAALISGNLSALLPGRAVLPVTAPAQLPAETGAASHFFDRVEAAAAAIASTGTPAAAATAALTRTERRDHEEEPDEWDDPVEPIGVVAPVSRSSSATRALFPVMPPPL